MTIQTRKPTGKPSWPIMLLAGAEKAGKSWACAEASASDLVGTTYWLGVGEQDADEYGAIPGADFLIVEHDGTYREILQKIEEVNREEAQGGKPNLLVVDSMTRIWDMLCDMAQLAAHQRAVEKAKRYNKQAPVGGEEVPISMDLWNQAKDRWGHIMQAIREHEGPVLLTARLEEVAVIVDGKPTTDKTLKIKAEKSLPYDVSAIVQMPERGQFFLTGVKTTRFENPSRMPLPGFTVEKLWKKMGLAEGEIGERSHQEVKTTEAPEVPAPRPPSEPTVSVDQLVMEAKAAVTPEALREVWLRAGENLDVVIDLNESAAHELGLPSATTLRDFILRLSKIVGEEANKAVAS